MNKKNIDEFLKVSMLGRTYKKDFEYDELCDSEKIILLLNISLFGKEYRRDLEDDEKISFAINRAYLDFCRTIRMDKEERKKARDKGVEEITTNIKNIDNSLKPYKTWFIDLCNTLTNNAIGYTFGQAQKWVNMTMKYLIVLNYEPIKPYIKEFHAPIDKVIIEDAFNRGYGNYNDNKWKKADYDSWSSNTMTEEKYNDLQDWIQQQANAQGKSPIEWEFQAWNNSTIEDK